MWGKRIFNILGDIGLGIILFFIVFASGISVVSVSPVSIESVLGDEENQQNIAGEYTGVTDISEGVQYIPSLASETTAFKDQSLKDGEYKLKVEYEKLLQGENKADILIVKNFGDESVFQVEVSAPSEVLEYADIYVLAGEEKVELTDELFEGKIFPYRLSLNRDTQADIKLVIMAKKQINYSTEFEFSIKKF